MHRNDVKPLPIIRNASGMGVLVHSIPPGMADEMKRMMSADSG
jgi:hypothetical protein